MREGSTSNNNNNNNNNSQKNSQLLWREEIISGAEWILWLLYFTATATIATAIAIAPHLVQSNDLLYRIHISSDTCYQRIPNST